MSNNFFVIITILLIGLIGSSFAQENEIDPNGYNKFYYKNGVLSSEGYMKEGKPNGYWKTYYSTGIIKSEGSRRAFSLDSTWVFYDEAGDTLQKINYYGGKKNGYHFVYKYSIETNIKKGGLISKELYVNGVKQGKSYHYKNNKITKIINYLDGRKNGLSKEYKDSLIITIYKYNNDYLVYKEKINRRGQKNLKQGTWKVFYKNEKINIECTYLNDTLNGLYIVYDKDGKPISTTLYEMNSIVTKGKEIVLEAVTKEEYFENGNIKFSGTYIDTIPVGMHKEFSEDGTIINATLFNESGRVKGIGHVNNLSKKIGIWNFYYESGELKSVGSYNNNMRTGNWKFYYRNASLEQEGSYKRGYTSGDWTWYYKNGRPWRKESLTKGKQDGMLLEFSLKGDTILKGEYIDGEREGYWVYKIGDHIEKGNFQAGLKNGNWYYYFDNGKLNFKGKFVQGEQNGKFTYYYNNKTPYIIGYYQMGVKEKNWKKFDPNGELIWAIKYKNDEIYKINGARFKLPKPLK